MTAWTTCSITTSTSPASLKRPSEKRIDEWASPSETPIALRTKLGSSDALVQADPLETATSRTFIIRLSPSTYANERFDVLHSRSTGCPLRLT